MMRRNGPWGAAPVMLAMVLSGCPATGSAGPAVAPSASSGLVLISQAEREAFKARSITQDDMLSGIEMSGVEAYDQDGDGQVSLREFALGVRANGGAFPPVPAEVIKLQAEKTPAPAPAGSPATPPPYNEAKAKASFEARDTDRNQILREDELKGVSKLPIWDIDGNGAVAFDEYMTAAVTSGLLMPDPKTGATEPVKAGP